MTATIMTSSTGETDRVRASLREDLESHRIAFLGLVDSLPDERWSDKSSSSAWTIREVLVHLTWALEQLPREIESARRGKGMFNYPKWLADPVSYWLTRWTARRETRASIRSRYETGISNALRYLDTISPTEWDCGARFYGEGFYTVADLFRSPSKHFADHTAGIRPSQPHPGE